MDVTGQKRPHASTSGTETECTNEVRCKQEIPDIDYDVPDYINVNMDGKIFEEGITAATRSKEFLKTENEVKIEEFEIKEEVKIEELDIGEEVEIKEEGNIHEEVEIKEEVEIEEEGNIQEEVELKQEVKIEEEVISQAANVEAEYTSKCKNRKRPLETSNPEASETPIEKLRKESFDAKRELMLYQHKLKREYLIQERKNLEELYRLQMACKEEEIALLNLHLSLLSR